MSVTVTSSIEIEIVDRLPTALSIDLLIAYTVPSAPMMVGV